VTRRRRNGFALLVVLWVMVSAAALTTIGGLIGRDAFHAGRNRVNSERALWRAEDCLARARAAIDALLVSTVNVPGLGSRVWRALDTAIASNPRVQAPQCAARLDAAGSRVDINGPDEPIARALGLVVGQSRAGALVDALLDWRDTDTTTRPLGAEAPWYAAQSRYLPRNDSLADLRELARVHGFEQLSALDVILGVEPGRISINTAPPAVLLAVPGFTGETVAKILEWRLKGWQVTDLLALESSLSRMSADSLLARFPDIARTTTLEPDAWILTSVGAAGFPPDTVRVELRLVRTDRRAVIVRRRSWM
jgi:type II secretory pathway component PulK